MGFLSSGNLIGSTELHPTKARRAIPNELQHMRLGISEAIQSFIRRITPCPPNK
ncbi:MAG: hypothetical protein IJR63_11350 [Synergistaceae bacterium]|nr:hypothetical protein [Synergistaceae bacterium]